MKKIYSILVLIILIAGNKEIASAQCIAADSLTYGFNNPNGTGGYSGFLCSSIDSVGTIGANGYFNGDAYVIKLVAGSQVTFLADSCMGTSVSLTVNDSSNNIIPGAYAAPACPNSLNFTAPYTGSFKLVMNVNGTCNVYGSTLLGEAYVRIKSGTAVPDCPNANLINDTICGAIALEIDSPFVHGNTSLAAPTDPLDGYVVAIGDSCSPPNNTLWYSFTSPTNIDTLNIWLTSDPGSGFHSWLIGFIGNNTANACSGILNFLGCVNGPDDNVGIDTISVTLFGIQAGKVYFFMIDGFNGLTGGFSIALRSSIFSNSINQLGDLNGISMYPNPANHNLYITSTNQGLNDAFVTIYNSTGEQFYKGSFDNVRNQSIDISNLYPGLYIVKIQNSSGTFRKKLIINN